MSDKNQVNSEKEKKKEISKLARRDRLGYGQRPILEILEIVKAM